MTSLNTKSISSKYFYLGSALPYKQKICKFGNLPCNKTPGSVIPPPLQKKGISFKKLWGGYNAARGLISRDIAANSPRISKPRSYIIWMQHTIRIIVITAIQKKVL